ncbi:CST complex subunit CTC1 [Dissostichus eleginoides]|uniref:CST complex subunit CTC1 n=1 Tax=Dissostichus eleginoides TaxID=100907 RepID=A0AAD9EW31_DISEL|nr:CST complex subunit CTC1 [Dissostichus eleginoides]
MSQVEDCEEAEPERDAGQSAARMKKSRVISYQGTVTEVVSEGAGLYVMDRRVGLCLAYQPALRRKLRTGDTLELHHVHFLYRPCPDFLPSMLCTCLRSTVRVTSFSGGGEGGSLPRLLPTSTCPGDGALPRLLLQGGRGLMECVWRGQEGQRRDIYCEMLDEPHTCPLTQYRADPAVPQVFSVSALIEGLQTDSWSSVSLRSLLPPGGGLSSSQINSALSWSCRTLTSDPPRDTSRLSGVCGEVHHGDGEIPPIRFPL